MTTMKFCHVIGSIMYVGCILSHIVIPHVLGQDLQAVYYTTIYKQMSAYILILPGLVLKTASGFVLLRQYRPMPLWLKVKLAMAAFLAINAFVFLVPMMSELAVLAKESLEQGSLSQAFLDKEHTETLVGMSNIIPLILALVLGVFKPTRKKEKSIAAK